MEMVYCEIAIDTGELMWITNGHYQKGLPIVQDFPNSNLIIAYGKNKEQALQRAKNLRTQIQKGT